MSDEFLDFVLPLSVYTPIDLTKDCDKDSTFMKMMLEIENEQDPKVRAEIAQKYITEYNIFTMVRFEELRDLLDNDSNLPLSLARKLYLFERSIPRRVEDKSSWLERLKIFTDTSTLERSIVEAGEVLGHKVYFSRASGDHTTLHSGRGNYGTDFYYWSTELNKAVFVEFKHWRRADIESAKEYYKDKIYGASNVIICTGDRTFYWVDYSSDTVTKLENIKIVEKLLIW